MRNSIRFWIRNSLVLFCITFFYSSTNAQDNLLYEQLSIEDGLPANEIYWTHQTKNGDLWMCSDHGVIRYDGINMKMFDNSHGLPGNTVFKCYEAPNGRLWFTTYGGDVFWIDNDSVHVPAFNEHLTLFKRGSWIDKIAFREDQIIMTLFEAAPYYFLATENSDSVERVNLNTDDFGWQSFYLFDEDEIIAAGSIEMTDSFKLSQIKNKTMQWSDDKEKLYVVPHNITIASLPELDKSTYMERLKRGTKTSLRRRTTFSKRINGKQRFSARGDLYLIEDGEVSQVRVYEGQIIHIHFDSRYLFVSTEGRGLFVYDIGKNGKDLGKEQFYFDSYIISQVNQDNMGNYWLSTVGNRLMKVPSFDIKQYEITDVVKTQQPILEPYHVNGDTLKVFSADTLFFLSLLPRDNLKIIQRIPFEKGKNSAEKPNWSGWDNNGNLYLKELVWNYHSNTVDTIPKQADFGNRNTSSINDTIRITKNFRGYQIFDNDSVRFNSRAYDFDQVVGAVYVVDLNHHYVAGIRTFYEFKNGTYFSWEKKHPFFKNRIQEIVGSSSNTLVLGSRGAGIAIVKSDTIIIIDQSDGLSSNMITKLMISDSLVYIGTNKGLDALNIKGDEFEVSNLISGNINKAGFVTNVFETKNDIIVQNEKSLTLLNKNSFNTHAYRPTVLLNKIMVSGKEFAPNSSKLSNLSWLQNDLDINYRINSLMSDKSQTVYKYRLIGLSENWTSTIDRDIRFSGLAPNEYTFEILAKDSKGSWSKSPTQFSFAIFPPWYKTKWFRAILILLGLFLVWLYFFLRQKELKRSKQLIYSNIEALKNQMNPHFIFNALNSVQYYIATEQKREANIFLSKLSGLVRNILDNSSRSQVNLAQEISRIKDYLELEHLRLNGLFKYSVSVQPELKVKSILLPPLLIQPVIENSIWHGFSDIDYMGELHIDFSVEKKNLVVTVMDNGVGMEIEKWKKSPAHYGSGNSIGLNNIVKRLYLISKIKNKEHKIEFNNIEKDPVKGTIIRLHIPQ